MRARFATLAIAAALMALGATNASAVELHGYTRTGIGGNSKAGGQACFQAPGADYKFRLANECSNYAEWELRDTMYKDKSGATFNAYIMVDWDVPGAHSEEHFSTATPTGQFGVQQSWFEAKGLPFLGSASLWVGKRYYRRQNVEMMDFFYWNASGNGAGVEDVDLGFGKLAVAVLQSKNTTKALDPTNSGSTFTEAIWRPDIRIYGIPVNPGGTVEVGADVYILSSQSATPGAQNISPWLTAQHIQTIGSGFNKLTFQYATGTAAGMDGTGIADSSATSTGTYGLTSDSKQWRVVEQLVFQVDQWSGQIGAMYQDKSTPGDAGSKHIGAGIRPAYQFSEYFKVQGEVAVNSVSQKIAATTGSTDAATLWTVKLAPTIVAGSAGFFARPEFRLFATYGFWNDEAQRLGVAGGTFGSDKNGLSFGAQLETWF